MIIALKFSANFIHEPNISFTFTPIMLPLQGIHSWQHVNEWIRHKYWRYPLINPKHYMYKIVYNIAFEIFNKIVYTIAYKIVTISNINSIYYYDYYRTNLWMDIISSHLRQIQVITDQFMNGQPLVIYQ